MFQFEKDRLTYRDKIKQFDLHFIGEYVGQEIIGWGAVKMTGPICKDVGIKHALLVTTGLKGTGIVDEVRGICKAADVNTTIWKVGQTNPRLEDVYGGVDAFKAAGADGILSVGGGSSHDTGKMIRMMLANPGLDLNTVQIVRDPPATFYDKLKPVQVPQISVNTTAGTGAEMTGFGVVTDWKKHIKFSVFCKNIRPNFGITDPAVIRVQPENMRAQTGIDAYIHGMGGVVSRLQNQAAKAVGLQCCKLVWENLPEFVANPLNNDAAEAVAWAQYLGALTYAMGGGSGPVHSFAHQISAVNNMHHGLTNAIMLIPVLRYIYIGAPERYEQLAREVMRIDTKNMDRFEAAEAYIDKLEHFRNMCGITAEDCKLSSKYGMSEKDFKHMAPTVVNDFCSEASVRDYDIDKVIEIYKSLG